MSSHQRLKPEEGRSRPTLQRAARDPIRDVAGIDPSATKDAKSQTEHSSRTESKKGETDSRHPQSRASVPNPSSSARTETFTHLRRNAVSDGIPYGDYRYLTGGLSEYECLQDAYRQKGVPFPYTGREQPGQSRNVSTEAVWNGVCMIDDVGEKKGDEFERGSSPEKGKEVRASDVEERSVERQR
ncbi:MAG: hypothetical protein Q9195_008582 [Heterodermia aff. obscurata]